VPFSEEFQQFFKKFTRLSTPVPARLSRTAQERNPALGALYHGFGAAGSGAYSVAGKRTIRITIERDRVWIIRQRGSLTRTWCESCADEVEFVSVEQAIALTGRTANEIKQSVLEAKLHTESGGGQTMRICLRSLLKAAPVLKSFDASQAS
jgi:hypothetical protein